MSTFPESGERWQVSAGGGSEPVWSQDGTEIFYRAGNLLMVAKVDTTDAFTVRSVEPLFELSPYAGNVGFSTYDVTPDGRRFAMVKRGSEDSRVVVVLNWLAEFEALSTNAP